MALMAPITITTSFTAVGLLEGKPYNKVGKQQQQNLMYSC